MLQTVHIHRDAASAPAAPRYILVDAGRSGEELGLAETLQSLTRDEIGAWLIKEGLGFSQVEEILRELDEKGEVQIQIAPRPGPRIVRAWFDTVINPVLESLELETVLIDKRNWTWMFQPPGFELIRPVRRYIESHAWANLQQIIELMPGVGTGVIEHDDAVKKLLQSVTSLNNALLASREFVGLCESLLSAEALAEIGVSDARDVFGAYPPEDRLNLIAQYVINNSGEHPAYYATAKLWNKHREHLLKSLDFEGVREHYTATLESGTRLRIAAGNLTRLLQSLRLDLSIRYDVPYVPSTTAVS